MNHIFHVFLKAIRYTLKARGGQSLIEVLLGLAIGAVILGAAIAGVVFMVRSGTVNQKLQVASVLVQGTLQKVRTVTDADWPALYSLSKGSSTVYYPAASGTTFVFAAGREGLPEHHITEGLVAYLQFDEGAGTVAYDGAGNNNRGSLSGSPLRTSSGCKVSFCLGFDGSDDYVTVTHSATLNVTSSITVAFWVRATTTDAGVVVAKDNDTDFAWEAVLASGSKVSGRVNSSGNAALSSSSIVAGTWTHVAMTYNREEIRVYLNGVLEGRTSSTVAISANTVDVTLGRRSGTTPAYFTGTLDDVRVYNRTLSDDDVYLLYNSTSFSRYFYVENVVRDSSGDIAGSGTDDPSTQKVTAVIEWSAVGGATTSLQISDYLTRWQNAVFHQIDWAGGSGAQGVITDATNKYATGTSVEASTTVTIDFD